MTTCSVALTHRLRMRRTPIETVAIGDCRQKPVSERIFECVTCGKSFLEGAVVNGPVEFDPAERLHFVHRKLFCDFCDHIQHWQQACDSSGHLRAVLISDPGVIRDLAKIAQFLMEYPQAAGVEQA